MVVSCDRSTLGTALAHTDHRNENTINFDTQNFKIVPKQGWNVARPKRYLKRYQNWQVFFFLKWDTSEINFKCRSHQPISYNHHYKTSFLLFPAKSVLQLAIWCPNNNVCNKFNFWKAQFTYNFIFHSMCVCRYAYHRFHGSV